LKSFFLKYFYLSNNNQLSVQINFKQAITTRNSNISNIQIPNISIFNMSAQFEVQNLAVESVVSFVDQKSMDLVVENQPETQPETQPKTKKELKMTKKTKKLIMLCGQLYGFDGEEAITRLLNHEKPKKEKKAKEPRKRKSVASNPEDGDKKKRGRPAKTVKVVEESQVVDMFADIVSKDDVVPEEEHVETVVETPVETKKVKKTKVLSEEEKEAKEAKKAQEKAEKEAEKEAKKAQEKAEKEAKKAQEKAQKEAEKAEKEAKKAEEKALKEAEKEAKKAEKPAKKAPTKSKAEKKAPASVVSTPVVSDAELEAEADSDQEPEQEVFKVKKFEHKGTTYLRTRNGDNWHENGHIYNMEQDLVGFWNEQNQDINFVEEGECVEEEYDE
jgi:hypothetical protein